MTESMLECHLRRPEPKEYFLIQGKLSGFRGNGVRYKTPMWLRKMALWLSVAAEHPTFG